MRTTALLKILISFLLFQYSNATLHAQWQVQLDVENFTHFGNVFFLDEYNGWAIGDETNSGPYFYTTDGGQNWYLDENWIENIGTDIVFVNHDTGFISANNGIIRKTVDGGQNWTEIQTPATQKVTSLFFVDENNGWATLGQYNEGSIVYTQDGGDSWELQDIFFNNYYTVNEIFFLNNNVGWTAGLSYSINEDYNSIKRTLDNGENWVTLDSVSFAYIEYYDIFFTDSINGWIVGTNYDEYFIKHTEDGGGTWQEDTIPDLIYPGGFVAEVTALYSIQFLNDTLGWITGADETNSGCIILTKDGGDTWQQQEVDYCYENPIYDICMVDNNNGWAVGGDYIYHTTNGDTIVGSFEYSMVKDILAIYPNPFSENIRLQIPGKYNTVEISIRDITGNNCFRKNENINDYIDLSFLPKGIYFITVQYSKNNHFYLLTKKIIKL
jgi:photosystem II stability/assembly factor-like uncharacterized protein